jgi:Uma2 family endonuclease
MASLQTLPISQIQLDRLADESGVEYVHGQIVEKPVSIESSLIEATVLRLLGNVAAQRRSAFVFGSGMGYQCFPDDPGKFRKPDVSVVRSERMAGIDPKSGFLQIPPDLAIEVLSPNDLAADIDEKVDDYLRNGFPLVWVIQPATRSVTVRQSDGSITLLRDHDEITAGNAIPEFRCKIAEFFPTKP